jgi:signal transduction histidine kinase
VVQLRQVLLNLVINAIHAMPSGGELRLETHYLEEEQEISICITDEGVGIDPELIERIFDPFFTTKPAGKGTGLGLYICYEIIRIHDGAISVKSESGKGTRFELRLPLSR